MKIGTLTGAQMSAVSSRAFMKPLPPMVMWYFTCGCLIFTNFAFGWSMRLEMPSMQEATAAIGSVHTAVADLTATLADVQTRLAILEDYAKTNGDVGIALKAGIRNIQGSVDQVLKVSRRVESAIMPRVEEGSEDNELLMQEK